MTGQPALFFESLTDAIKEVVRVGGGLKVVGAQMWPEKTPDAAARTLADCLNENREARLSPDQLMLIIRLGRARGCHAVMSYMAQESGYSTPFPIEPADEAAELQRQYIESTKSLLRMAERIERLRSVA
jgi:hypothetical protein